MNRMLLLSVLTASITSAQQYSYPPGTLVRITATAKDGYNFDGWIGDVTSTDNPLMITLDANSIVTPVVSGFTPPPLPSLPQDAMLTVTAGEGMTGTVEVVETPSPPPASDPDYFAEIVCPDANGVYQPTTIIPNDPYGDGCLAAPFDVGPFFSSEPYDCAHLRADWAYLGPYPFDDGGSITTRKCVDVVDGSTWKLTQNFGPRERMVAIIHNDVDLTAPTDIPYMANKGELFVVGIPNAQGRPPRFKRDGAYRGTVLSWQSTSGNVAVVNVVDVGGEMSAGSGFRPIKQTITLVGVSNQTDSRMLIVSFEGGGGSSISNDPTLAIDDEVYLKNVLEARAKASHNIYLDRVGLTYIEGLVSYGNRGDGNHALKTEGRRNYIYGSYLSAVGVNGNLADDFSGQTPLSGVACSDWVVKDNKLVVAQNDKAGGNSAISSQVRVAIVGCDYPQGWYSNTYPTTPYMGPVDYRGEHFAGTPYWDASWWNGIDGGDTYGSPDLLRQFFLRNHLVAVANGTSNPAVIAGVLVQPTFPVTYPSSSMPKYQFTQAEPPREWKERNRALLANNCFEGGGELTRLAWNGGYGCSTAGNPSWVATWPGCVAGEAMPVNPDPFVIVGENTCGQVDELPPEAAAALAMLESIPDPPWRHWR